MYIDFDEDSNVVVYCLHFYFVPICCQRSLGDGLVDEWAQICADAQINKRQQN